MRRQHASNGSGFARLVRSSRRNAGMGYVGAMTRDHRISVAFSVLLVACQAPGTGSPVVATDSSRASALPTSVALATPAARSAIWSSASSDASYNGQPVDQSVAPVSRSHPSDEARSALDQCLLGELDTVDRIVGMGRIAHLRDVSRYVAIGVDAPQYDSDSPAWVLQLRGETTDLRARLVLIDPACIVADGESSIVAVGGTRDLSGDAVSTPRPLKTHPDRALPSMEP